MASPAHKVQVREVHWKVTIWGAITGEKGNYYTVNPSRSYKKGR